MLYALAFKDPEVLGPLQLPSPSSESVGNGEEEIANCIAVWGGGLFGADKLETDSGFVGPIHFPPPPGHRQANTVEPPDADGGSGGAVSGQSEDADTSSSDGSDSSRSVQLDQRLGALFACGKQVNAVVSQFGSKPRFQIRLVEWHRGALTNLSAVYDIWIKKTHKETWSPMLYASNLAISLSMSTSSTRLPKTLSTNLPDVSPNATMCSLAFITFSLFSWCYVCSECALL